MNRVDPRNLSVRDLRAELQELEESWMETLLRGSEDALEDFADRTRELEEEFDRRKAGEAPPPAPAGAHHGDDDAAGPADVPEGRSPGEAA
ncbi:DUF6158 family protein [Sphaerisporangium perillae]|uniref:DUF6158 family protein n=1 Tax=Sphaerisporangium perillae TaxID=2935860 RepID=UPI0020102384|nr:DUF6158 family protein [Sphaerisporangium perillae]